VVAADTLEAAIEGAALVRASYAAEPIQVTLDAPESDIIAQADSPLPSRCSPIAWRRRRQGLRRGRDQDRRCLHQPRNIRTRWSSLPRSPSGATAR